MPQKSDLNEVKNHRNIKFINVKCGSSNTVKIVGGTEADLGEFPWMALLRFKNRLDENSFTFNCGGEISFEIRENRGLIEFFSRCAHLKFLRFDCSSLHNKRFVEGLKCTASIDSN